MGSPLQRYNTILLTCLKVSNYLLNVYRLSNCLEQLMLSIEELDLRDMLCLPSHHLRRYRNTQKHLNNITLVSKSFTGRMWTAIMVMVNNNY